jgi:hypothetical protein
VCGGKDSSGGVRSEAEYDFYFSMRDYRNQSDFVSYVTLEGEHYVYTEMVESGKAPVNNRATFLGTATRSAIEVYGKGKD